MRPSIFALMILGSGLSASGQTWSAWQNDAVFPGIEIRARCTGFNEFANRFVWDVQLRNTYQKEVDFAWAAQPDLLRGAQAQMDHALSVRPGEVVDAHHTAPQDCSSALLVKVNDVRSPAPRTSAVQRKQLTLQLSGNSVTGIWSSPNVNIQITTPLPESVRGSVSIETK